MTTLIIPFPKHPRSRAIGDDGDGLREELEIVVRLPDRDGRPRHVLVRPIDAAGRRQPAQWRRSGDVPLTDEEWRMLVARHRAIRRQPAAE